MSRLRGLAPLVVAALLVSGCQTAGAVSSRRPSELARPVPAPAAAASPERVAQPAPTPPAPAGPATPAEPRRAPGVPGPGPVAQLPTPVPAPAAPQPGGAPPAGPPAVAPAPQLPARSAAELLNEGEAALAARDYAGARSFYEELLLRYPADPLAASALFRLGELALLRSDYTLAQQQFQELLLRFPGSAVALQARYRLAYATYRLGRIDDAIEILKSLLSASGLDLLHTAQTHLLLAQGYEATGRPLEAARTYASLLALPPPEEFRADAQRRLERLLSDGRLSREQLAELAAAGPGVAAPLAKLQLAALAIAENRGSEAERLAREVLAAPLPPEAPPDLLARARTVLDDALRLASADPGVVGVVLPLSGKYEAYGERLLHGLMVAAGILAPPPPGQPAVRLAIRDTGGDPAAAARAVEELVWQERAIAVVGPLLGGPAEAAAKAAQRLGVPLLALSQRPRLTEVGPFVFRPFTTNALQGRTIAREAMARLGLTRFAILYPEDVYGTELMRAFSDEVRARGGTVVETIGYRPGQTDFGKEIRQLAKLEREPRSRRLTPGERPASEATIGFDALFIPDYYDRVGLIAPQLAYYNVTGIQLLGASGWNSPQLIRLAREYVEGALFVDGFWVGSPTPAIGEFVDRFRNRFDTVPTLLEAEAYDALRILLDVLRRTQVTSREALAAELAGVQGFPGLIGPFSFTPDREPDRPLLLLTVKDGKIRQVN